MQQETVTNDERPSRERKRPAKFDHFEASFNLRESSELDDEPEEEGAPPAPKRQKKNQKSQADKKGAKRRAKRLKKNEDPKVHAKRLESNRMWKEKKKRESPDYFKQKSKDYRDKNPDYWKDYRKAKLVKNANHFKEKNKAFRKAMLVKKPNYFNEKNKAWRKRNKNYRLLTLLRPVKHFEDYFEAAKKEVEKKHQPSKRSIGDLSHVFDHALGQDPLLAKSLEDHAQARQPQHAAYNLRSNQVQHNIQSL